MTHPIQLDTIGRFECVDLPGVREGYDILYRVTGLPPGNHCVISYAGRGDDHKGKWGISWFREGKRVPLPRDIFDSTKQALLEIRRVEALVGSPQPEKELKTGRTASVAG